jgi:hypothetical protein
MEGLALLALVVSLVLVAAWAIWTVLLRMACGICDVETTWGRTALASFLALLANVILKVMLTGILAVYWDMGLKESRAAANLVNLPFLALASAAIYMALLKTTFGRAFVVFLVQALIAIGITIVVCVGLAIFGAVKP